MNPTYPMEQKWYENRSQYLWQAMGKEHLDYENKLTERQWDIFIKECQDGFAERCSEEAGEFFSQWTLDNRIELD